MSRIVRLLRPGIVSYSDFLLLQEALVQKCKVDKFDTVLILQHPPTYTAGRREAGFSVSNSHLHPVPCFDTLRGGQITFHGYGQLMLYPILDLTRFKPNMKWYVNNLQQVIIETCKSLGILKVSCDTQSAGVWVEGSRKIGFIGFQNSRWIVSHGASLNVNTDLDFFSQIVPCGHSEMKVTSVSHELKKNDTSIEIVEQLFQDNFSRIFDCHLITD